MNLDEFKTWISAVRFGKRLPTALYFMRLEDWTIIPPLFISYPDFDADPHPALAEGEKLWGSS